MSCAALKFKFEKSGVFFIFNNSFLVITISRDDKDKSSYTSIDIEFQGGSNGMSCVALKCKHEIYGAFFILITVFLAITISLSNKNKGSCTPIDR